MVQTRSQTGTALKEPERLVDDEITYFEPPRSTSRRRRTTQTPSPSGVKKTPSKSKSAKAPAVPAQPPPRQPGRPVSSSKKHTRATNPNDSPLQGEFFSSSAPQGTKSILKKSPSSARSSRSATPRRAHPSSPRASANTTATRGRTASASPPVDRSDSERASGSRDF